MLNCEEFFIEFFNFSFDVQINKVQAIPSLKDKVEKINKEKINCLRQIAKFQEEFDEKEDECKQLKATVAELKDASNNLKEIYEFTIRVSFKNYVKCNYKLL